MMECAACNKPAILACSGCKSSPILQGDNPIAYYCSATCQKANWPQHKALCHRLQDRTTLYRVSDFAQRLFFIHRETMWSQFDVERVEKSGVNLFLRGETIQHAAWPRDYKVFPTHMFSNEEDRRSALTLKACIDAWRWMNEFFEGMLKALVRSTELIIFKTKNDKRRTRCYLLSVTQAEIDSDIGGIAHEVLKVTLRSGEQFVVDLSCPQYGYFEPVMRWEEYRTLRILFQYPTSSHFVPPSRGLIEVDDYSLPKMLHFLNKMSRPRPTGPHALDCRDDLEAMNLNMLEWQADEKLSIKKLLKLPEREFQRKKDDLVDYLDWKLDNPLKRYFTVSGRRLKREFPRKWIHGK